MQHSQEQDELRGDLVIGRNAVMELLKSDRSVECIYLQKGVGGLVTKIVAAAQGRGIVCKQVSAVKLDHLCGHAAHQGIIAQTAAAHYAEIEDILARAQAAGEPLFIIIADEIEDPHNLGAIIRTAEAAGAHGLVIPKRRSAGLSYVVSKTSAGASAHLPVARVSNLAAVVDSLKKQGVWVYAADMDGQPWCAVDYAGPVALVVGSEGTGVSRLLREKCDFTVSVPMRGKISSLNVSVATGIICYEIARQRLGWGCKG